MKHCRSSTRSVSFHRGERIAWGTAEGIVLESVGGTQLSATLRSTDPSIEFLAFADDDHLVAMNAAGRASILAVADGGALATQSLTFDWAIANTAWRPASDDSGGTIVLSSSKPGGPLRLIDVAQASFSSPRQVAHTQRSMWPEGGRPPNADGHEWLKAIGLDHPNLELRAAKVQHTKPDPTGRYIAITQKIGHNEGFDEARDGWVVGPHDFVVTLYERESGKRRWTHAAPALRDLAWSSDGRRLGVAQDYERSCGTLRPTGRTMGGISEHLRGNARRRIPEATLST